MSCILRIGGDELDSEKLAAESGLAPYRIDRKGTPAALRRLHRTSAIHVDVSRADFSALDLQVRDAIAFLASHEAAILRTLAFPGVEDATLDFGVNFREMGFE